MLSQYPPDAILWSLCCSFLHGAVFLVSASILTSLFNLITFAAALPLTGEAQDWKNAVFWGRCRDRWRPSRLIMITVIPSERFSVCPIESDRLGLFGRSETPGHAADFWLENFATRARQAWRKIRNNSFNSRIWLFSIFYLNPIKPCSVTTKLSFFAPSVHIKLDSPQAARLSIFYRKISSVAPQRGTWIKDALLMG